MPRGNYRYPIKSCFWRLRGVIGLLALMAGCARLPSAEIEFGPIIGAVTPSSAELRISVKEDSGPWSAIFRPVPENGGPAVSVPGTRVGESSNMVAFNAKGLSPDTEYDYAIVCGDGADGVSASGTLRTFPAATASFEFTFASCSETGSNHEVYSAILKNRPLFHLSTGDLHYEDIAVADRIVFFNAYKSVFTSPRQAELYATVPFVYMWDDHDFGPNDSDKTAPGRTVSRLAYQEVIPHYPLIFGEGDIPISQAFSVGRARFVLTDLRSERYPAEIRDDEHKTMLGSHQKEWFKREILAANESHAVIFWVSSVPWIARAEKKVENWGAYATERAELAEFFAANNVDNLILLSGDAHMLAADDGANANYAASGQTGPRAVLQAGSLDRPGSYKGGPYSHGSYLPQVGEGCFGHVKVSDDGESIRVIFSGRNHLQEEKIRLEVVVP